MSLDAREIGSDQHGALSLWFFSLRHPFGFPQICKTINNEGFLNLSIQVFGYELTVR